MTKITLNRFTLVAAAITGFGEVTQVVRGVANLTYNRLIGSNITCECCWRS